MAFETTVIQGVTKFEWFGTFWYKFANETLIEADLTESTYRIYDTDKLENKLVPFSEITDKLDAANVVEYVEKLIDIGAYKDNTNITATIDTTGLATEAKQDEQILELQSIKENTDVTKTNTGYGENVIHSNIPASLTQVTLVSLNSLRRETHITNNSNGVLYVKYGSGVTSTNYTYKLFRSDAVTIDDFRGEITGIGSNATGFYMIEENSY